MNVDPDGDPAEQFLALYQQALPEVYGYLLHRCGEVPLAEDLTSEVFLAAVRSVRRGDPVDVSIPWLVAVARHKLIDHWRRQEREDRGLRMVAVNTRPTESTGPEIVEEGRARAILLRLPAPYRAALTLRYVDGLPVAAIAMEMDRTIHATESLLARARAAFRRLYREGDDD